MHPDGATVGHVIPYRDGGTMALDNLAAEHRRCNLDAGARDTIRARVVTP
jgi:5-methylcytosine-specific restriction endonuclease McrA